MNVEMLVTNCSSAVFDTTAREVWGSISVAGGYSTQRSNGPISFPFMFSVYSLSFAR